MTIINLRETNKAENAARDLQTSARVKAFIDAQHLALVNQQNASRYLPAATQRYGR
jgi:hypothetical protein